MKTKLLGVFAACTPSISVQAAVARLLASVFGVLFLFFFATAPHGHRLSLDYLVEVLHGYFGFSRQKRR